MSVLCPACKENQADEGRVCNKCFWTERGRRARVALEYYKKHKLAMMIYDIEMIGVLLEAGLQPDKYRNWPPAKPMITEGERIMGDRYCFECRWWQLTVPDKTREACMGQCFAPVPISRMKQAGEEKIPEIAAGCINCSVWTSREDNCV